MAGWLEESGSLSAAERQQYIDAAGYLPDDILTKVDRASMAASLEARVPVLDHRIVEFAFRLPPAMKTQALETKRILRHVLGRHVPAALFERTKQGFGGGPVTLWMQGPLRDWAYGLMSRNSALHQHVPGSAAAKSTLRRLDRGKIRRIDFRTIILAAWCERNL